MQIPKRKPGKFTNLKNDPYITKDKFDELEKELERLKDHVRPALAKEVSRLAELGDFSENAEYQLAKGKLRGVNNAILKIEAHLKDAIIIKKNDSDIVQLGNFVTVEADGKKKTFQILGSSEVNIEKGIISYSSPLGSALMGKKIGEFAKVKLDKGERIYKIIKIN